MRQIQIFVPKDKHSDTVEFLQDNLGLANLFSVKGDTNALISLRINEAQSRQIVEELKNIGVGVEYGLIDVLPIVVSVPLIEEEKEDLLESSLSLRVVSEELHRSITADARISLDYLWFIVISALVAGLGILQDSGVAVVASMLLAPLMGPILGFSMSYVTKDRQLSRDSLIAEGTGLCLSLVCGIVLGLLTSPPETLPAQMASRGNPGLIDLFIALLSGLAVTYALGRGTTSSLVGVAIAASLMPPAVNVGIALMWREGSIALGSLILLLANIIIIDIAAIGMFTIMKIQPVGVLDATWTGLSEEQVGGRFSRRFGRRRKKKPTPKPETPDPKDSEEPSPTVIEPNPGFFARLSRKPKEPDKVVLSESEPLEEVTSEQISPIDVIDDKDEKENKKNKENEKNKEKETK